ncbi:MAG TPA: NAD(P)/FAD-dependent oxidoreductase [Solirubrobacterales bacterium]|nr:NAD(P)/FAD-dependent oxidoreductase [Solirubrobacterales bacterium]
MSRTPDTSVAIIGSGFAGLGMAIRLKREGIEDFIVLERAADLGGTWRDNHYPGLSCDIPSHVYSFSFELNPDWTRGFAPGWEIQRYLKRTAEKYGILPHLRYDHEVLDARWEEDGRRWRIQTTRGDVTARVLVSAAGGLSEPSIPDLPGLGRFQGRAFHSADWDHDHDLDGRSVAVIGTGASAIQFVPQIQPRLGRLHLFQRTPPWVVPRLDHEITGLEHEMLRRIPFAPRVVRWALYWLMELRVVLFRRPRLMRIGDRLARKHLARQVPDPGLRSKLTPDYVMGCKRVLISDDYYPALTQPNVDVVTSGITEVREASIVDGDGNEREVDTIIFGTGFEVTDLPITHRVRGGDGRTLAEHWDGSMQAYLGSSIAGFPNLFMLVGPNTGLGHNSIVFMIESQINYVVDALRTMRRRGIARIEVRPEVQDRFNEELQREMEGTVWTAGRCQSWYLDDTGRNTTLWPGWTFDFRRRTRRFDPAAYLVTDGAAGRAEAPAAVRS